MTAPAHVEDYRRPDRDLLKCHPLVQERWPLLNARLAADGFAMLMVEGYRSDLRQAWLYGQGRTVAEVTAKGISAAFARPGARVTNAWSARVSAHGITRTDVYGNIVPASAALDVVPVGADGRPWTADDPFDAWLATLARYGAGVGMIHFTSHGKITDQPHLQLVEYSDVTHTLVLV